MIDKRQLSEIQNLVLQLTAQLRSDFPKGSKAATMLEADAQKIAESFSDFPHSPERMAYLAKLMALEKFLSTYGPAIIPPEKLDALQAMLSSILPVPLYLFSSVDIETFEKDLKKGDIAKRLDENDAKQITSMENGSETRLELGGRAYIVKKEYGGKLSICVPPALHAFNPLPFRKQIDDACSRVRDFLWNSSPRNIVPSEAWHVKVDASRRVMEHRAEGWEAALLAIVGEKPKPAIQVLHMPAALPKTEPAPPPFDEKWFSSRAAELRAAGIANTEIWETLSSEFKITPGNVQRLVGALIDRGVLGKKTDREAVLSGSEEEHLRRRTVALAPSYGRDYCGIAAAICEEFRQKRYRSKDPSKTNREFHDRNPRVLLPRIIAILKEKKAGKKKKTDKSDATSAKTPAVQSQADNGAGRMENLAIPVNPPLPLAHGALNPKHLDEAGRGELMAIFVKVGNSLQRTFEWAQHLNILFLIDIQKDLILFGIDEAAAAQKHGLEDAQVKEIFDAAAKAMREGHFEGLISTRTLEAADFGIKKFPLAAPDARAESREVSHAKRAKTAVRS
jgi:hypothetical protein